MSKVTNFLLLLQLKHKMAVLQSLLNKQNETVYCLDGRSCLVTFVPMKDCKEYHCGPCDEPCDYVTDPFDKTCRVSSCSWSHKWSALIALGVVLLFLVATLGKQ